MADDTGRRGSAKKTATKGAAKKTTARQAPTKKTPAKKTSAKTASRADRRPDDRPETHGPDSPREERGRSGERDEGRRLTGTEVAVVAAQHLQDLTGKQVEGVVGLERTDDGWKVEVEVLELRRVPTTTDMLAVYEVGVDDSGDLISYRRLHRYVRGASREDDR